MIENMGKRLTIPHQKKKLMRKYYDIMFSNFLKGHLCVYIHIQKKNLQRYTNIIVGLLPGEFSKVFIFFLSLPIIPKVLQ